MRTVRRSAGLSCTRRGRQHCGDAGLWLRANAVPSWAGSLPPRP